jgi:hypothetical protein
MTSHGVSSELIAGNISAAKSGAIARRFWYFNWWTASRAGPSKQKAERMESIDAFQPMQPGQRGPLARGTPQREQIGGSMGTKRERQAGQIKEPSFPQPAQRRGNIKSYACPAKWTKRGSIFHLLNIGRNFPNRDGN